MHTPTAQPELTRAQLQMYRSLKRKQKRLESGLFLVEGIKSVRELIHTGFTVEALLHVPALDPSTLFPRLPNCSLYEVPAQRFKQLCETVTPEGVLAVVRLPKHEPAFLPDRPAVYLDGIHDPGNLGTILRSADWFGLEPLLLSHDTADPFSGKVIRSSMGSIFHVPFMQDTIEHTRLAQLQKEGRQLVGLTLDARQELHTAKLPPAPLLVMGGESRGIRPEIAALLDMTVRIPGSGRAESLNVAQAFTIVAYQLQVLADRRGGELL